MKKRTIRNFLFALATLTSALSSSAKLNPTQEMAAQTRWVVDTINARHYLRGTMEQLNGAEIVEAYIESFDYGRMYFTRAEIDDFIFRFGDAIEEFLNKGNLSTLPSKSMKVLSLKQRIEQSGFLPDFKKTLISWRMKRSLLIDVRRNGQPHQRKLISSGCVV